jgi:hypothetical protein
VVRECIFRFYWVFRLIFRRSIGLQMRFDAHYRRVADTATGVYYFELTASGAVTCTLQL